MMGGLRLFPSNMQTHSFSKRQLAATVLMLDGEKNTALSDKKRRMWVHKCFGSRKSEGEYWTLYKELAYNEMNGTELRRDGDVPVSVNFSF
jgi:hypothetical protein